MLDKERLILLARKQRDIPDQSLSYLDALGFLDEALDMPSDEEAVRYLLERFADLAAASPGAGGRRQTLDQERSEVPVSLSESERERQAAFEEYAAKRAACDDGVRWFRDRLLEGHLLTAGQARELVRSPAARFLEAMKFEFAGGDVPLVGHRATLEGYERVKNDNWAVRHRGTVSVDPPGTTETVEDTFYDPPRLAPKRPRYKDGTDGQALYYVNERGRPRYVSVWDRSVLADLRNVSERLARWYRWEPPQATMFVLTGATPAVPALKVGTSVKFSEEHHEDKPASPEYIDSKVIIEASPWVPEERVTKAYRKAKRKAMGTSGGKAPKLKNLILFRFVTEKIEPACRRGGTRMPNGKGLVREWNEAHPEWKYKNSVGDLDTRRFWRDYNRIRKTIAVGPPYQTHHT
jgi:hypothetical protein